MGEYMVRADKRDKYSILNTIFRTDSLQEALFAIIGRAKMNKKDMVINLEYLGLEECLLEYQYYLAFFS